MTGRSDGKRPARVAEAIRAILMELLLRGDVHDPQSEGVMVSDVRVTDDLGSARVYLRLLTPNASATQKKAAVSAMTRAAGFLRRALGERLRLKKTPELRFFWDESLDHAIRIESLLEEIRTEDDDSDSE